MLSQYHEARQLNFSCSHAEHKHSTSDLYCLIWTYHNFTSTALRQESSSVSEKIGRSIRCSISFQHTFSRMVTLRHWVSRYKTLEWSKATNDEVTHSNRESQTAQRRHCGSS